MKNNKINTYALLTIGAICTLSYIADRNNGPSEIPIEQGIWKHNSERLIIKRHYTYTKDNIEVFEINRNDLKHKQLALLKKVNIRADTMPACTNNGLSIQVEVHNRTTGKEQYLVRNNACEYINGASVIDDFAFNRFFNSLSYRARYQPLHEQVMISSM